MIKIIVILSLILTLIFYCTFARAGELNWDGTPVQERVVKKDEPLNKPHHFMIACGLLTLVTIGDIELTFNNINNHGAREGNPMAKPFFERGRGPIYAYAFGANALLMIPSYLIFRSKDPDIQRKWLILPTVGIIAHGAGIGFNLAYTW